MKGFFSLLFAAFTTLSCYAQDTVLVVDDFKRITDNTQKKQETYYALVEDAAAPLQGLVNFYNKKDILCAAIEFNEQGIKNGKATYFYPDGGIEKEQLYRDGIVYGPYKRWYSNGQQQEEGEVIFTMDIPDAGSEYRLYQYWDSLGTQLLQDGRGELIRFYANGALHDKGSYMEGLKIGKWLGYHEDSSLFYEEEYQHGKLVSGRSHKDGKVYAYTKINEEAMPVGEMMGMYKHLAKTIEYPREAVRRGIQGTVHVKIEITETGLIESADVVQGVGYGLDEEAVRVVRMSKWKPAKYRGIEVKQRKIMPVKFTLQRSRE